MNIALNAYSTEATLFFGCFLRSVSRSGQIGLWRFSYSFSWPGFTDITNALRIIFMNF